MTTEFARILSELSDPFAHDSEGSWHEHSPSFLASLADCGSPDSADSPGAEFLARIARDVAERFDEDLSPAWVRKVIGDLIEGDAAHEIADSAVPIYTHERWQTFVDLAAYEEDVTDLGTTAGAAGVALYMIAERLVRALAEELSEALDTDSDDDSDEYGGVFTDLATGQKAYVTRDGAGRYRLTWSNGVEIGDGYGTVQEVHEAFGSR